MIGGARKCDRPALCTTHVLRETRLFSVVLDCSVDQLIRR